MPKKRSGVNRTKFDKTTRVKAVARKRLGSPPPARILDDREFRAKPKYKKDWTKEE